MVNKTAIPIVIVGALLLLFSIAVAVFAGVSGSSTVKDNLGNEVPSYNVQCIAVLDNKLLSDVSIVEWSCPSMIRSNCKSGLFSFLGDTILFGVLEDKGKVDFKIGGQTRSQNYEIFEQQQETLSFDFSCIPQGENPVSIVATSKESGKQVSVISTKINVP